MRAVHRDGGSGCYTEVVARLSAVQERGGEAAVHPKVARLRREMQRARRRGDPGDTDFKVLVAVRREAQWVCRQLEEEFGSDHVALLSRLPEYDHVLHLLEQRSVVVWEEGEALHQLPCLQFSLVVEWEGNSGGTSVCVDHCTRQNIHVVSLTVPTLSVVDKESASMNESSDQREVQGDSSVASKKDSTAGLRSTRGSGRRASMTVVASHAVTANNELHYILTSMYDINLIERNARDVMMEEGRHGWADLVLDERTCVLLRPLATLRSDVHLNELTCQMVLLSMQCTTCYILLYAQHSSNSGYEFRSSVVRALTRLVATCALFRGPDYTICLLLAFNLHQVGEVVRRVCEATRTSSPVWDAEEWVTRPWLTSHISSHERVLLSLPCLNSISAQVILTAMSLVQLLRASLPHMRAALPWIPDKVILMLYKFINGEPVTEIKVGRYSYGITRTLSLKESGNILHRPMTMEEADKNAAHDPQQSVYNPEDARDSKAIHIPAEGIGLDETQCGEEQERIVPPIPSHYLPDKVSLFTSDNEDISIHPHFNQHSGGAIVPWASVPPQQLAAATSSSHPAALVPPADTSHLCSTHPNASSHVPPAGSVGLDAFLDINIKDPPKDMLNAYNYLHCMPHDSRLDMQAPQQCQQPSQHPPLHHQHKLHQSQQLSQIPPPPQYQQMPPPPPHYQQIPPPPHYQQMPPPPQYQQPPQQCQPLQQSLRQQPPHHLLGEQGRWEPKREGDVVMGRPYDIHESLLPSRQAAAPPPHYHHHALPQPSTLPVDHQRLPLTSQNPFLPQAWRESLMPSASLHPFGSVVSGGALEGSHQRHQEYAPYHHHLYANRAAVTPHQWQGVKNETVSSQGTVHQSHPDSEYSDGSTLPSRHVTSLRAQHPNTTQGTALHYQKMPGWGSQTKLVFNPNHNIN